MSDARARDLERRAALEAAESLLRERARAGDGPWLPRLAYAEDLAVVAASSMLRHFRYFADGLVEVDRRTGVVMPMDIADVMRRVGIAIGLPLHVFGEERA
jgi:hypothetical protein